MCRFMPGLSLEGHATIFIDDETKKIMSSEGKTPENLAEIQPKISVRLYTCVPNRACHS